MWRHYAFDLSVCSFVYDMACECVLSTVRFPLYLLGEGRYLMKLVAINHGQVQTKLMTLRTSLIQRPIITGNCMNGTAIEPMKGIQPTPSPGWGPRRQGPRTNRQGPGKNNWTVHVKKSRKTKWQPCVVFHAGWSRRPSHTHSYPGCHEPDRLVVALADHGCSQYTTLCPKNVHLFIFQITPSKVIRF